MLAKTNDAGRELFIDELQAESGSLGEFYLVFESNDAERLWGYYCSNCNTFNEHSGPIWKLVCGTCTNSRRPE